MHFFKEFPKASYIFGNQLDIGGAQVTTELFQDISRYTDVIDQVKDNVSFHEKYYVLENDRPDQVSFDLYGTTIYHWTFFLMNEHLRTSGWPLTNSQLDSQVKKDFPHKFITVRDDLTGKFIPGQIARGLRSSATGEIQRRYLDLGTVVIDANLPFLVGEAVGNVSPTAVGTAAVTVVSTGDEYLGPHHYEDVDGNYVDIDPLIGPGAQLTEITHYDRYIKRNDSLKEIIVIKPEFIGEIVSAFHRAIKS